MNTLDPPPAVAAPAEHASVVTVVSRCKGRLEVLAALAARTAQARTVGEALEAYASALDEARSEVPFSLVYLFDSGGTWARLAASTGFDVSLPPALTILECDDPTSIWPLRQAMLAMSAELAVALPPGPWPESSPEALVMALRGGDDETCFGFLVIGEALPFAPDDGYRTFLRLVCQQLTATLAGAAQRVKLEGAARAAETAARVKDEFLAILGHELRNPLAPIMTALQITRMRGSETRELVVIDRQVRHLVRLVDDLLDLSRITGGKVALRKQRFELSAVVARGMEMVSPLLDQKKQRLDLQVSFEGLTIEGDADRLAQVVSNLMTNAAKYSDDGTTIHVTAERADDRARLSVRDEGVGIPGHMLDAIFDSFVQQSQPLDRSKGGLGLGLTIVRSLVELHDGTVAAFSEGPGTGSEFVVELPLAQAPEELDGQRSPAWPAVRHTCKNPSRNRVLIVDDNRDAADSVGEILGELGYEVAVAYDGPSALTLAQNFKPHICVLDIGLPVMDGYELAQRLRQSAELPQPLHLIALTGYGQDSDRRRSREAGFDAHLVKPVQIDELARMVTTN